MPIITPAYPAMCSTHNVMHSTKTIMTNEFRRAAGIVDMVMVRSERGADGGNWAELFEKHDFFHTYRYYLQVISSSSGKDSHKKWSGTVDSKLRQLVMKLENSGDAMLDIAHPFVKGFEQVAYCLTEEEVRLAAQGDWTDELKARTEADVAGKEGAKTIWTMTFYIGLQIKPKQRASRRGHLSPRPARPLTRAALYPLAAGDNSKRKLDISYPTTDFMKQVKMIDSFEEATMGIVVRHIRKCVSSARRASATARALILPLVHTAASTCLSTCLRARRGPRPRCSSARGQ